MSRAFSDVEFGEEFGFEPDVSLPTVTEFARTVGMHTARFTDHEGAKKQGLPGAIVPGIMSQALLASLIHRFAPGCRIKTIDTVFRAPVLVDTRPLAKAVVTDLDEVEQMAELDLTITNEAGETRVLGTATVYFPDRPSPAA